MEWFSLRNGYQKSKAIKVRGLEETCQNRLWNVLYGFVSNLPEKAILKNYNTDKIRARKAFSIIRDKNYELFKDFYECHQVSFKGGNFCNE